MGAVVYLAIFAGALVFMHQLQSWMRTDDFKEFMCMDKEE